MRRNGRLLAAFGVRAGTRPRHLVASASERGAASPSKPRGQHRQRFTPKRFLRYPSGFEYGLAGPLGRNRDKLSGDTLASKGAGDATAAQRGLSGATGETAPTETP